MPKAEGDGGLDGLICRGAHHVSVVGMDLQQHGLQGDVRVRLEAPDVIPGARGLDATGRNVDLPVGDPREGLRLVAGELRLNRGARDGARLDDDAHDASSGRLARSEAREAHDGPDGAPRSGPQTQGSGSLGLACGEKVADSGCVLLFEQISECEIGRQT
nr:hypothetical protein [Thiocapsa sp.]